MRVAPSGGANFLLSVAADETAAYCIVMVYKASSNGRVNQYIADPDGYQDVADIKGDGQFNTVFFYARPPYRDYRVDSGVNVLFDITRAHHRGRLLRGEMRRDGPLRRGRRQ